MKKQTKYILAIIAIFLLQFVFINPLGEFSLNDSWVHTEIAYHLVETGVFRMSPYAGPTFYFPILLAAGLIKIFGMSFSILRISTLFFSLGSLLLFFLFLNKINKKYHLNFILTLLLFFNPIFYNLSFTFLTDISALFLFIASLYFYHQGFDKKQSWYLFVASLLAVLGFYTRQTNILIMLVAGLYSLSTLKKFNFLKIFLAFSLPTIIWLITYILLLQNNLLPQNISSHYINVPIIQLAKNIIWWIFYTSNYLGFLVLPISIAYLLKKPKEKLKNIKLWNFIFWPVIITLIIRQTWHQQFPYIKNITNLYGVGPMQEVLQGNLQPLLHSKILGILSLLFAVSFGTLTYILFFEKTKKYKIKSFNKFIYLNIIIYLLPILTLYSFDKYYLPVFVLFLVLLSQKINFKKIYIPLTILLLLIYAIFSISQTQFYLNWNKVRWQMANTAVITYKITNLNQLDAGYEWDGWYTYWLNQEKVKNNLPNQPWWIKHIFINNTADYVVSFSPLPNYQVLQSQKVQGWNPNNNLYLLKR